MTDYEDNEKEYHLTVKLRTTVMAESYEDAINWLTSDIYANIISYDFDIK
jgi:hypothetical protein